MPRLLLLVIGLLLGAAAGIAGYRYIGPSAAPIVAGQPEETQRLRQDIVRLESDKLALQTDVRQLQGERDELQGQLASLEEQLQTATESGQQVLALANEATGKLTIAEAAREALAEELSNTQQEVSLLQQNLAFFEQLIPENSKSSAAVSIRSADVAWHNDALRFRVLVMRTQPATKDFEGRLEFTATGKKGGQSATITLERLASAPTSTNADGHTEPYALHFRQYQRINGQLDVPAGFEPQSVTVKVLEGKAVKSEHTIGIDPKESTP